MNTNFDPILHGYKFPNRFEKNLPNFLLKMILKDSVYGLCGGMVFSALDNFLNQSALNQELKTSDLEPEFINLLWKRQFDSMPIKNYLLLTKKTFSNDLGLLQDTFKHQIPLVIETINKGIPAAIIIIRSKNIENPTDNHQILLIGYKINGPITEFTCYDPNHPSKSTILRICMKVGEESISQSTGEFVRGFFVNNYQPKLSIEKRLEHIRLVENQ
jgi:hypothetical protein